MSQLIQKEDFWRWAYSDFLSNSLRGILSEYIVGQALGCISNQRTEWDAYDLKFKDKKIEVKSAAYIQAWKQEKNSIIRFDIAEKSSWFADTNEYSSQVERPADIYVFCVFEETNRDIANPLDVNQWFFLVMSRDEIYRHFGKNKTVSLSSIEALGVKRIRYTELKKLFD